VSDKYAFIDAEYVHPFGPVNVNNSLVVAARVDFGEDGGFIGFTGAGRSKAYELSCMTGEVAKKRECATTGK
jgi:hypothetical protein